MAKSGYDRTREIASRFGKMSGLQREFEAKMNAQQSSLSSVVAREFSGFVTDKMNPIITEGQISDDAVKVSYTPEGDIKIDVKYDGPITSESEWDKLSSVVRSYAANRKWLDCVTLDGACLLSREKDS